MRGRIFRTTLFVTLITLVVCTALIIGLLFNFFENSYTVELKNEADYIASSVEEYGLEYVKNIDFGDLRVSYISKDGTVLYDNRADVEKMANHSQREEFVEAIEMGSGENVRLSETLSEKNYYMAKKLRNGDVVRISDTRVSEWALMARLIRHILLAVILSVILSGIFSGRLSKGVVKPINAISLEEPEKSEVYDELEPLITRISEQNKLIRLQMEQLKRERKEFEQITSNMSEGFIVVDTDSKILSSNTAATRLLGKENLSGESIYSLNKKEKFIKCVESALVGNGADVTLLENGRFISVIANPVYEKKHVIGALLIMLDVTEKEGREAMRREFTANVSHELKTPLTSIVLAAEMMKSGIVKQDDIKGFSERIYCQAQRLISLINDIIKLSKLDEGAQEIIFEKRNVGEIVKKAISLVETAAKDKKIEIVTDLEDAETECVATLIQEAVYNLCDNAVKYNNENGKIEISVKKKGEKVCVTVEDDGIGIPENELGRIFERFYRVDKSHADLVTGTGLGLSIVKHAMIIHKGEVNVKSQHGKGSRFELVF